MCSSQFNKQALPNTHWCSVSSLVRENYGFFGQRKEDVTAKRESHLPTSAQKASTKLLGGFGIQWMDKKSQQKAGSIKGCRWAVPPSPRTQPIHCKWIIVDCALKQGSQTMAHGPEPACRDPCLASSPSRLNFGLAPARELVQAAESNLADTQPQTHWAAARSNSAAMWAVRAAMRAV